MNHTPINAKPRQLDDFVFGNTFAESKLRYFLRNPNILGESKHGILLHGDYGAGKTELAMRLPEMLEDALAGSSQDVLDADTMVINCCLKNVEKLLNNAQRFAECMPIQSRFRYVVLDELDALPTKLKRSLKGIISSYPSTCWIATANKIDAIDDAVRDRLSVIAMPHATPEAWVPRVQEVLKANGKTTYDDNAVLAILLNLPSMSARDVMEATYRLMD